MPYPVRSFPLVPSDPLRFWQKIHPRPRYGFFLGTGVRLASDPVIYMSAGEPGRILQGLPKKSSFRRGPAGGPPRFVGLVHFDAGREFDDGLARLPRRPDPLRMPRSFFGDYSSVVKIDFKKKVTTVWWGKKETDLPKRVQRWLQADFREAAALSNRRPRRMAIAFRAPPFLSFKRMVEKAKDAIRRGDIYQANLSLRFEGRFAGQPVALYRRLCEDNPSPYACLLKAGPAWIVSNSPELLIRVQGRRLITRPIAGTRPRGKSPALDRRRRGQLLLSPKERAEHIMLVDLERNDLGRVCEPGSVEVTDRYEIERYSHVMHIVSEVRGRLRKSSSSVEALQAVFPGGTITGCPKIKSVEIIEGLERVSRGIFYGSAGYFTEGGDAAFNILIRTAYLRGQRLYIQAGAGIVADSHPRREYREILAKSAALRDAARRTAGLRGT